MDSRRDRNLLLLAILFGLACSIMAYGLHWNRGPHHDDYFMYNWSFLRLLDLIRGEVRPVGKLVGAVIYSQPEVVARLFGAAMLIGTSLLSGLLVYRLTKIRLAAVSVIFLCLLPFAGAEATTWTSAVVYYMPSGFFALLALNLFLAALRAAEQPRRGTRLALLSGLMLVLALGSIEPAANFYILFLGLLLAEMYQHPEDARHMLKMSALATLIIVILGALIYVVFYINASEVTRRGAFELPSLERIGGFLIGFYQRGLGGPYGQELIEISFKEGWKSLLSNRIVIFLALITIALAIALNLFWKMEAVLAEQKRSLSARLGILMIACLLTTIASLLLPSVLLSHEDGSPRLNYLPGISGILFIGCCIAWLMVFLRTKVTQRIILALVTFTALVLSLHLFGYTRIYQLRYMYDRLQLGALHKAVPAESIAGKNITFLPYEVSENFLGYHTNTNPNFFLIGGFSSPNSLESILEQGYPQTSINVIRPGYGNFTWGIALGKNRTLVLSGYEGDPSQEIVPDNLILFRFRQNATVELAEKIQFTDGGGAVIDVVTLPLATRLHEDYNTRTFVLERPYRLSLGGGTKKDKFVFQEIPPCELMDTLPSDVAKAVTVNYGNKVSLLGITSVKLPKNRLRISLYWRQVGGLGADNAVFVHFTDDNNRILFQGDHSFCQKHSFEALRGKVLKETQFIDVPLTASGKDISVKVGIYDATAKNYDRLKIESVTAVETDENYTRAIVAKIRF